MAAPADYSPKPPFEASLSGQRQFKKHKVLPRPRHERTPEIPIQIAKATPPKRDLLIETSRSGNGAQPSSPRTLKHQSRRIGSGPDLPPTPPRHSRKSSDNSSGKASSPSATDEALQTPQQSQPRPPTTPPNQKSPPTPDVTPPHHASRPKLLRPDVTERPGSSTTTVGSQSGSFTTAREELSVDEDEDRSANTKASRSTVRQVSGTGAYIPQPEALGLALANLPPRSEGSSTSRSGVDWGHNDSDWGSVSEVEQEWDHNLQRLVTVKKRPQPLEIPISNPYGIRVVEPNMITPTQAAKAVRNLSLHQRTDSVPSAKRLSARDAAPSAPSSTVTASSDPRRASAISTKSTVSTVVEAYLLDATPKRQRTLRHVRKQTILRDPLDDSPSSTAHSLKSDKSQKEQRVRSRPDTSKHESQASSTTLNSVSSGRARREVWKSGGIPVVVVPDRLSSHKPKSSKEPSLRSRSSRTASISPAPNDRSTTNDEATLVSRESRGRRSSVPDDSDQRTIDYPPIVPARSSSLSAPTSRNGSRASSLTAESIKLHNALQESLMKKKEEGKAPDIKFSENVLAPRTLSNASEKDWAHRRLSSERHDDFLFAKGYGPQNTPFSLASVDTNGTNPVVSEALAVQMYPHQNSSLLVVDHSTRPSESLDEDQREDAELEVPLPTDSSEETPVTPPQTKFSFNDIDSPLRNPRAPPEPPKKPPRRPSVVRRAFSRHRRHSVDFGPSTSKTQSFLTRRLSLSRTRHGKGMPDMEREPAYPSPDDSPAEENKLHPFWRPQWSSEDSDDWDGYDDDGVRFSNDPVEQVYRYPPVDNRPSKGLERSFSARMKRTFAVLPREDSYYTSYDWPTTERRTIGRTPSGNLRVMRHRASLDSLRRNYNDEERPYSALDGDVKRPFWRSNSLHRRANKERHRLSLGSRLEEIHNLRRKLSERRREKRSRELRQKISGPKEVRDGVGDVIRSSAARDHYQTHTHA
ncbi:hypothetical protein B0J15DRAFT_511025 [Fusarium solani]|uniref:Uncharacterized protein n=1 Tax=Fusarium solani TaxID=169388 RepID=A0A9P9KKH7_FUSSL|nr:uncharacterized protein B0J15DRAFT_511025 [Fusarium solani]KAH7266307.1 hypothetical protein B0J15DRAFT_511025 [Fusarium solani]